eukprot:6213787-Pleurochrysis_carterae.AAC.8
MFEGFMPLRVVATCAACACKHCRALFAEREGEVTHQGKSKGTEGCSCGWYEQQRRRHRKPAGLERVVLAWLFV